MDEPARIGARKACAVQIALLVVLGWTSTVHAQPEVRIAGTAPPALIAELEFELPNLTVANPDLTQVDATGQAFAEGAVAFIIPLSNGAVILNAQGQRVLVPGNPSDARAFAAAIAARLRHLVYRQAPAPATAQPAAMGQPAMGQPPPVGMHPQQLGQPQLYSPNARLRYQPIARFDWQSWRKEQRRLMPWRLRIAVAMIGTPRACDGVGAVADNFDEVTMAFGFGLRATLSKWVRPAIRVDLPVSFSWVLSIAEDEPHGPEGSVGVVVMFSTPKYRRWGLGVGLEGILARELDTLSDSHFGWMSFRILAPLVERGWIGKGGTGVSVQFGPTFTYVPYVPTIYPGLTLSIGVEFGVAGSNPPEPDSQRWLIHSNQPRR